jgi:hypothetical protein
MTREEREAAIRKLASEAAGFADSTARSLLMVGLHNATTDEILHHLPRAYAGWSSFADRMAKLEQLAPKSAELGYEHSMMCREIDAQARADKPLREIAA